MSEQHALDVLNGTRQWCVDQGDSRDLLKSLPDESVQCVITSPPYWGLRDYGTASWDGGDAECLHRKSELRRGVNLAQSKASTRGGGKKVAEVNWLQYSAECADCGAVRADRQLGLEPSPQEYVAQMVELFREVKRVLRPDGTLWLNMGDSYNSPGPSNHGKSDVVHRGTSRDNWSQPPTNRVNNLKPKDLIGVPWRLAFALQDDGWWLRSDIIWAKPNPMPESVTDRPTKAHEYIFLLTKSARYYYDADAVRIPSPESTLARMSQNVAAQNGSTRANAGAKTNGNMKAVGDGSDANLRSVWNIATAPFKDAHFATFPPKLIEPCVKAGTSEKGQCSECGAPWVQEVGRPCASCGGFIPTQGKSCPDCGFINDWKAERTPSAAFRAADWNKPGSSTPRKLGASGKNASLPAQPRLTRDWHPSCSHDSAPVPQVILDPFAGAGTTGLVATRMDRRFIGLELNPEYAIMARYRIYNDAPLLQQGTF